MESFKLKTHIGSDGLLKPEMPVGVADVDVEVVTYTVQPKPAAEDVFLGADDPIERPAKLSSETRGEIAPLRQNIDTERVSSMNFGKIILLNGPSSAGKSTLAKVIQQQIAEPFWHVSSDQFVDAQMLPHRRTEGGDFGWQTMRPRFFRAFHRCLPAIAGAENNLIVDHVIEFADWMRELVELLAPYDVFFVGIHCALEELDRRERMRGNRMIGEARAHWQVVHTFGPYDYAVDSSQATAEINAQQIITAWKARTKPSAFHQMYKAYPHALGSEATHVAILDQQPGFSEK